MNVSLSMATILPKGSSINISIIEDNRYVREGWEAILRGIPDFSVIGVYDSCEEAFRSSDIGTSDLVLMDIGLPGIDGIEGVKILQQSFPKVIVIMCTVYDDDQKVFDAICAGAVGYLLKKTSPEDLIKAIRIAVQGGSPMTPSIARKVIGAFQKPSSKHTAEDEALTDREMEVLNQMALGKSYAAIANDLFLSVDGVRYHIRHIYEKLHVHSRSEAIARGLKDRLIQPPR